MYSYKVLNFQESTTIVNVCTKKSGNLLNAPEYSLWRRSTETSEFSRQQNVGHLFNQYEPDTKKRARKFEKKNPYGL